jgi:ATP/maltotriose-dependent transcriptional regulator MalT
MIGNWLALFYLYNGDTAKMAMVLEVLHPLSRHATIAPFTRIVMLILESYLHHVRGEREACLKAIEKGKETATTSGVHALDFFLFASGLNISLACGDLDSARNNLENIAAVLNWKSHNDVGHY